MEEILEKIKKLKESEEKAKELAKEAEGLAKKAKRCAIIFAVLFVVCLIFGVFFAIKSLQILPPKIKGTNTEKVIPPFDPKMLVGDYRGKYKIGGELADDALNGYIDTISTIPLNKYRITILYSDSAPEYFSFIYDGTILAPDFSETKLEYKGNRIIMTFKKDNQLWEFSKRL